MMNISILKSLKYKLSSNELRFQNILPSSNNHDIWYDSNNKFITHFSIMWEDENNSELYPFTDCMNISVLTTIDLLPPIQSIQSNQQICIRTRLEFYKHAQIFTNNYSHQFFKYKIKFSNIEIITFNNLYCDYFKIFIKPIEFQNSEISKFDKFLLKLLQKLHII